MSAEPILVTGSSGRIGKAVCGELLSRGLPVRGFDLVPDENLEECITGSLTDPAALERAMENVKCLIHLAATPDEADFESELLPNNLVGVYNLLEAARKASVSRVVLASSIQMNWGHSGPFPITVDMPETPLTWYAATKAFAEAAGHLYSAKHGIQVIMVRPGFCPRVKEHLEEISRSNNYQDLYFSPGDAGRLFACLVEANIEERYCIIYGASKWIHRPTIDLEPTKQLCGYEPRDQWPQGIEVVDGFEEFL